MFKASVAFAGKAFDLHGVAVDVTSCALDPTGSEEHTNYNSIDTSFLLCLVKVMENVMKPYPNDYVE